MAEISLSYVLGVAVILLLVYKFITRNSDFFERQGVKYIKATPVVGAFKDYLLRRVSFVDLFTGFYYRFPNEKFFGMFEFMTPVYYIRDPDLIRQITVKDFDHFVNHRMTLDQDLEPMLGRSLVAMKDQKWRDMRSTLSPAFTGSKMRQMFPLIVDCSINAREHIKSELKKGPVELEMKEFFTRFTNDVIATCAFGIQIDSLKDVENEFFRMGKVITNFDGLQGLKLFAFMTFPNMMKLLKVSLFKPFVVKFFRNLVHGTMKYREDNNIVRPDMINLLMQAKQGYLNHDEKDKQDKKDEGFATVEESDVGKSGSKLRKWTDDDLTSQCLLFFLAGFDTVSTLMCFMSYELAINQDIQDKLREEIDSVKTELNGDPITYDRIQKMKYLDMCVSEALRKWPPGVLMDRSCSKATQLEYSEGKKISIDVGQGIWIPAMAIQNDPQYFPNPKKFIPERFSDENKNSIKPFTYFPFGLGPRNCIGSRFALMEAKAVLFEILSELKIELSPKSQHPIKIMKNTFALKAEKGFWFQFKQRTDL